jgi:hypothetical protein
MEPEGSLQHSQVLSTCLYPKPAQFRAYLPILPLEDPSKYYPPIYTCVSPVVSFPQVSPLKPCTLLSPLHKRYMPIPSHSRCYHQHNSWWGVQIMEQITVMFSPHSSSLLAPNILLNTLFFNALSLRSSLNISDKFHTHISLYIFINYYKIFINLL